MAKTTVEPADRGPALKQARDLKMARSLHAYVRGATDRFYAWLETASDDVPEGPAIWICGDCHLGNLGPLAAPNGQVDVRIRDLDQTVIGNPAHDLIRLGLSLATSARAADLPGVVAAYMMEAMVEGYEEAMREPVEGDAIPAPAVVATTRSEALGRRWRKLAKDRLGDSEPTIPIGKRFWPLSPGEREAIAGVLETPEVRHVALGRGGSGAVRLLDAAYWRKGCSSLGKLRFAATLELEDRGDGKPGWVLIDIKEAPKKSVAPGEAPSDAGQRVVTGARALTPELGDRMAASHMLDRSVVVRELKPQDLKLECEQFAHAEEAAAAARYLAWIVGRAHGGQMDAKVRKAWASELGRRRPAGLEAPSWLWRTIVGLASDHEAGYLEHCRRYALKAA